MNIDSWLTQFVTVAPMLGRSGSGDPTYGAKVTMRARIERSVRLRVGMENVLADVHVMITKDPVTAGARVWFPGDDVNSTLAARRPLSVSTAPTKDDSYTFYETHFAA